mmetsp:Transcript_11269/g.27290  ORF Transcript_11269/g.27290 Transcript_11269/m.27290 type:complete len:86 (+) Transcript_11269:1024-1281(+)
MNVDVTKLGSMLFTRFVSGTRVVPRSNSKVNVCHTRFEGGFGGHCASYPCSYMSAAAAIGMTHGEVDTLCAKLSECLSDITSQGI